MVYWYFGSLALRQAGEEAWTRWRKALGKAVLRAQHGGTDWCKLSGSWDPAGAWGTQGGRVYATAIMVLTLLAKHRYPLARRAVEKR